MDTSKTVRIIRVKPHMLGQVRGRVIVNIRGQERGQTEGEGVREGRRAGERKENREGE
jgi:hypothetical protein